MDQVQEHTHTYDRLSRTQQFIVGVHGGVNYIHSGDYVEETIGTSNKNAGGTETRVKNLTVKLWQRIS